MMVAVVMFVLLVGGAAVIGVLAAMFLLVFGPDIRRRAAARKRDEDFLIRYQMTQAEWIYMQAHTAGMSTREWVALPLEDQNLITLSWDLAGKRGGPNLPAEEMQWRADYAKRVQERNAKHLDRLRKKRGLVAVAV